MASIRKLNVPENVTLVRGAMQNWSDLEVLPPVADVLSRRALTAGKVSRCLVAGPHQVALLHQIAEHAEELVVVVRSIPDAETIGNALPDAKVVCGDLDSALSGSAPFDLVLALRDASLLASSEEPATTWHRIADRLLASCAESGRLLLGVEADTSLGRLSGEFHAGAEDSDGAWSPFSTWDESRPRRRSQIQEWLDEHGATARVDSALTSWHAPTTLAANANSVPLRRLWTWAALRAGGDVLPLRSLTLADRSEGLAAGWLVDMGQEDATKSHVSVMLNGQETTWEPSGTGELIRTDWSGTTEVALPPVRPTLLEQYVIAAADEDLHQMRRILALWRTSVERLADGSNLTAETSDVTLANALVDDDGTIQWLLAGNEPLDIRDAQLRALSSLLRTLLSQGLRHPWMSSMHHATIFEALCAQAGVPHPPDAEDYVKDISVPEPAATPATLRAVIQRQREELRGAWSRFHWDEKDYVAYQATKQSKRAVRWGARKVTGKARAVKRRVLGS